MQNVTQRQITRSAAIISIGNILSRMMGLVRGMVISSQFGAESAMLAYTAAKIVPLRLYELVVGGMITSALVPTLSEYTAPQRRDELWRIASLLFTLATLALGGAILLFELGAPLVTRLLASGFDPALQAETTRLLRIAVIGILFLGLSGLTTALCQALQRFTLPAFTTAVFNTSIVLAALALGPLWGVRGLTIGLVVGALLQFVLQIPALRDLRFRPHLDMKHPVLRRILRLYLPIALGMIPNELGIMLDRNLASRVGNSLAIMEYATQLIQFPLGLVSIAISTAILPTLSRQAAQNRAAPNGNAEFRATLAGGLRLVLVLTLPAAVGLLVLANPVVALFFQHGAFTAQNTVQTAQALRLYLIGMIFAAIDQPLVFAFYAQKDTVTPALVGVLGVALYTLVALPTYRVWGMTGLLLGNGAQLAGHAATMLLLFRRQIGGLSGFDLGKTLFKSTLAAAAMGGLVWGVYWIAENAIPLAGKPGWALSVFTGGAAGIGAYLGLGTWLRIPELDLLRQLAKKIWRAKIARRWFK